MDYKKAGVDISAGEKAVELIKPLAKSTFSRNVVTDIGSFGALFKLDLSKWKQPILVSSTDSDSRCIPTFFPRLYWYRESHS
jgi:phosphoribosylformylglycinamidine cyclo-ligase